jgi:nuclear mitotic apparatus protein 1
MSQLREFASHLQQLQGALNELTEEHSKATQEWTEKQTRLEKELSTALQDKVICWGVSHNLDLCAE